MKGQKKMKKFLAIVFSLIFALSACTVAFAAADFKCPNCLAILEDQKALDKHLNGGCQVAFKDCKYGCGVKVSADELADHYAVCPKYSETCEYCGEKFDTAAKNDAHECKILELAGGNETIAGLIAKLIDALKNIDWAELANKVIDFVKGIKIDEIVGKVKPVIEKVVDFVGKIELPAAK